MPACTYLDPNDHLELYDDELTELRDGICAIEGAGAVVVRHKPRRKERLLGKPQELEPHYDVCHQVDGFEYQIIMSSCGPKGIAYNYLLGYLNGLEKGD